MPKKGGGKKGKKGKKGPVDWAQLGQEKYVDVEVRNSVWQSLRFTQRLPVSTKIVRAAHSRHSSWAVDASTESMTGSRPSLAACAQEQLVKLVIERHQVAGMHGLSLYLGESVEEASLLRPEEYGLSLGDVKCPGGSINDHVLQVVTYDYQPHRTADTGSIPPSRSYGVMHVPRNVVLPQLRQWGPV
jgi:hypothetical protein